MRKSSDLGLDDNESWRARPYSELHATNDGPKNRHIFDLNYENCPDNYWPVYKGSSFNLWEPDTGEYYGGADPIKTRDQLHNRRKRGSAFSEFEQNWINDPLTNPPLNPRIAFRQVTNRTNTRTIVCALIPPEVFITNAGPYMLWPRGTEEDVAYLLGIMSSISFDW